MNVNHKLTVLICGEGEKTVSAVFTFTTQRPTMQFWEFYEGLLQQIYGLETYQETLREWLRGVHTTVRNDRLKTQTFYGKNKTMRFTYQYRPELTFLQRLAFGRSWTWNRIVKLDN